MNDLIYLDYNATTPVDPEVFEAMKPYFIEHFGNPSSNHKFGWQAEKALEQGRKKIAQLIGAEGKETIIFTSGATEANNLCLKGIARSYQERGKHIISQKTEHESVLEPLRELEKEGFEVTLLPCNNEGQVLPETLAHALTEKTILVSIMTANNEIGTLQPLEKLSHLCKKNQTLFHTDAAQALGKIPLNVQEMGIDLLSASGHKIYAPKGIGFLYVAKKKPRIRIKPLLHGGGHERGLRSGTPAIPLIVGFAKTCEIAVHNMKTESQRLQQFREEFWQALAQEIPDIHRNGDKRHCLPGTLNISFGGVDAESLLLSLSRLAISSGSACAARKKEPSHVLLAMGLSEILAHSSLRFSFGRFTTQEEITVAKNLLIEKTKQIRKITPSQTQDQTCIDSKSIGF